MKTTVNPKSTILLIICIIVTSISIAQSRVDIVLKDISASSHTSCDFNHLDVLKKLYSNWDLKDPKVKIDVITGVFGSARIPALRYASLGNNTSSVFGGSLSQKRKKLKIFAKQSKEALLFLENTDCNQGETNFYRALGYISSYVDGDQEIKSLVIVSDLVEGSTVFEPNLYINHPKLLLRDFDKIVTVLEKDMPLPNLSGVDITIINNQQNDLELYFYRFWRKLFFKCGAKSVSVRTAI